MMQSSSRYAKQTRFALAILTLSVYSTVVVADWGENILQAIKNHPEVASARANLQAQAFQTDGAGKPIYNPEIAGEIERTTQGEVTTDYQFGISQTVDWWDKGKARLTQAKATYSAGQYAYQTVLATTAGEALMALAKLHIRRELHVLVLEQEARLKALLTLVEKRHDAGDVGALDVELTFLTLVQRLNETATIAADMQRAEQTIKAFLPTQVVTQGIAPNFWRETDHVNVDALVKQHPKVQQAYYDWQATETGVTVAETQTKADPTFGVYAGNEDDDPLIGVQFSIPLFVRNNFQAKVEQVKQQTLAAQSAYQSVVQQQQAQAMAALTALQQFQKHYAQWINASKQRVLQSDALLQQQWRLGDISTSDYLRALQQRSETLESGLTLKGQWQQAFIAWLQGSGQLVRVLSTP